ncbi:MAG: response regulator [Pontiellaceae bacterium]|nr:response regulator [Pontiellaceae bacterium]MBN2784731.1 response regulator [Pontiellaceae bacterium]
MFLVSILLRGAFAQEVQSRPRVLILNSYHTEFVWTAEETEGIRQAIRDANLDVQMHVEFIDTKRIQTSEYFAELSKLMQMKYGQLPLDLVVATDDNALNFVQEHRKEIFPQASVVFCGVNYFQTERLHELPQTTGVNEEIDAQATIDLMLKLHPGTKRIFVVNDTTTTGKVIQPKLESIGLQYEGRVEFRYLQTLTLQQIEETLSKLESGDLVLLTLMLRDSSGRMYEYDESARRICAASPVPVYGVWDFNLKFGIVGGKLASGYYQGLTAGKLAVRILKGEAAVSIAPIMQSPNHYMFDWVPMQRFGIAESSLPEGSIIMNRPEFFHEKYRTQIFIAAVLFVVMVLLLLLLWSHLLKTRQREFKFRSLSENLRITLQAIGDAVIVTDENAVITRVNPTAVVLTGYPEDELIGQSFIDRVHLMDVDSRQPVNKPIRRSIASEEEHPLDGEWLLMDHSDVERRVSCVAAVIRDASGTVTGMILIMRDITEQFQVLTQLHQSQKMDSVGQLAGGIAHDFNNMLLAILGAAELLDEVVAEDEDAKGLLQIIEEASMRASDLTKKLLAFSRKGMQTSTPVDMHQVIGETISLLKCSIDKRVRIETRLDAEQSMIVGDPSQLQNALLNLGINARDAMPDGGTLTIATSNIDLDDVFCQASPFDLLPGAHLEVTISDTGHGMAPETLGRIFEPFFTTKDVGKGTGLGLAAVYGAIKAHQGAIHAYSELGEGTVFRIYLSVDHSLAPVCNPLADEVVRGEGTVLLVDDEHVLRKMGMNLLQDLGYQVILAEDGPEALEIYKARKDEIDLVVMDMVMPKMTGRQVFAQILEINSAVRVLFSSGFTREGSLDDVLKQGACGFIQKPYRRAEFSRILSSAMRS